MEDEFETLTVTIAIDEDSAKPLAAPVHGNFRDLFVLSNPPKPLDACPLPPETILVRQLPRTVYDLLAQRLNPPAIGSMRNWEHLGANMEITGFDPYLLRSSENPTEKLLNSIANFSVKKLIAAIGEIERIDVLLNIAPYIEGLESGLQALGNSITDSAIYNSISLNYSESKSTFEFPKNDFILVTFYIPAENEEKKLFKFFFKNLEKTGKEYGITVLPINKCIDETNIQLTLQQLFYKAKHIVLYYTQDYNDRIWGQSADSSDNSSITIRKSLNELMNTEFFSTGSRNNRFRYIYPESFTGRKPNGWPSLTLSYKFPESYKDLCQRLFIESGSEK